MYISWHPTDAPRVFPLPRYNQVNITCHFYRYILTEEAFQKYITIIHLSVGG